MALFNLVVADPPWNFSDKLAMDSTPRGAESNYSTLSIGDIKKLKINELTTNDSLLVLWVPSSLLQEGLDVMSAWGFKQVQTFVWVKIIKYENVLKRFEKSIEKISKKKNSLSKNKLHDAILHMVHECLNFFMGRLFRQTHEIALVGKKGNIYNKLQNKSQRSVLFDINKKHSAKPEGLQDRLDIMFPSMSKIELFARRSRKGWVCVGNESPSTLNEDIRDSIERLLKC